MDHERFSQTHIRHYGFTLAVASSFYEAMRVSLDRHHTPSVNLRVLDNGSESVLTLGWLPAGVREKSAWNNKDDATRDGAYLLALTVVESLRGLVTLRRAETRTGADYYVAKRGTPVDDLENMVRVEVSGIDSGSDKTASYRLTQKLEQARNGDSNLPAVAVVVEFSLPVVTAADLI